MSRQNVDPKLGRLRARLAGLTATHADQAVIDTARRELRQAVDDERNRQAAQLLADDAPRWDAKRRAVLRPLLEPAIRALAADDDDLVASA